jgi:gluconokinase
MSKGVPLTDDDRFPWLEKVGQSLQEATEPTFIACSALKRSYRERIIQHAERPVIFLYLQGTRALLCERLAFREGHFMPAALLDSQLETLEPPESDEMVFAVSIDQTPDKITAELLTSIRREIA